MNCASNATQVLLIGRGIAIIAFAENHAHQEQEFRQGDEHGESV